MGKKFAVMQGRLVTNGGFQPQQFPWDNWEKEFFIAADNGFHGIEWMFNYERWKENPLVTMSGRQKINEVIIQSGVEVQGICANYFMQKGILKNVEHSRKILQILVESARAVKAKYIVIPLFEDNEAGTMKDLLFLLQIFGEYGNEIPILIETDYDTGEVVEAISKTDNYSGCFLCYDIGNSIGCGKPVTEELSKFLQSIFLIHIKDKKAGGCSCMLGEGDALWAEAGEIMEKNGYNRYFTFESYYAEEAYRDTITNAEYIRKVWKQ